ncbi:hypothetical protein IEQ34_020169 [Dendrobium chrysotoxum]|uniref:Uncharacterized protein n=1 Tax=Dendrobium chrysotoxum TaxID=161865 RepID=A0AAV7G1Q6_DENCH|nr:hypothetical protein IEQ34_020169 [Dendrobium chrysotoxum]
MSTFSTTHRYFQTAGEATTKPRRSSGSGGGTAVATAALQQQRPSCLGFSLGSRESGRRGCRTVEGGRRAAGRWKEVGGPQEQDGRKRVTGESRAECRNGLNRLEFDFGSHSQTRTRPASGPGQLDTTRLVSSKETLTPSDVIPIVIDDLFSIFGCNDDGQTTKHELDRDDKITKHELHGGGD